MKYIHYTLPPDKKSNGFLLVSLLVTTFLIIAIGMSASQLVVQNYQLSLNETYRVKAQLGTDAGADYGIQQIAQNSSWTGTGGEILLQDATINKTTYEVVVATSSDGLEKTMTVTGRTYAPITNTTPRATSKVVVGLKGVGADGVNGNLSVYAGVGGLILETYAAVNDGEVFVNGKINLSTYGRIGTSVKPVNVKAAYQSCPTSGGSTYPQICTTGQPISIGFGSQIYGEVRATNQTNGASMQNPGLVAGTVAVQTMPTHNRDAITGAITTTQTGTTAGCSGGTKTWPANLKITGDVTINNYCDLTVEGNVWITGTLTVTNYGEMIVKNGLSIPPKIIVDGSAGVTATNSAGFRSNNNATPVGFKVITDYSTDPCTTAAPPTPSCTNLTGTVLLNSSSVRTIFIDNYANAPNTQFYARWSMAHMNNYGDVGSLVGQTVKGTNSAEINFGLGVDPSQSGTAGWIFNTYKRSY